MDCPLTYTFVPLTLALTLALFIALSAPLHNPLARYKKGYRQKLDELEVSKETSDRLVHEANVAFNLNTAIFEELDVICGK